MAFADSTMRTFVLHPVLIMQLCVWVMCSLIRMNKKWCDTLIVRFLKTFQRADLECMLEANFSHLNANHVSWCRIYVQIKYNNSFLVL